MIATLLTVIFFATSAAFFTHLVDYCLGGMTGKELNMHRIFSRLGLWIQEKYQNWEDRENERLTTILVNSSSIEGVERFRRPNMWKALAVCPVCFNVWIGMISGIALVCGGFFSWWFFIPYIVISNYILRRIYNAH